MAQDGKVPVRGVMHFLHLGFLCHSADVKKKTKRHNLSLKLLSESFPPHHLGKILDAHRQKCKTPSRPAHSFNHVLPISSKGGLLEMRVLAALSEKVSPMDVPCRDASPSSAAYFLLCQSGTCKRKQKGDRGSES